MIDFKSLSLLVVDDDPLLLKVMSTMLRRKGSRVFEATNGREALEGLADERIDLVISDIQMPVMDGIEMLQSMQDSRKKLPPVLFITGQSRLSKSESQTLGAVGLMEKPISTDVLCSKIEDILSLEWNSPF